MKVPVFDATYGTFREVCEVPSDVERACADHLWGRRVRIANVPMAVSATLYDHVHDKPTLTTREIALVGMELPTGHRIFIGIAP